MTRLTIFSEQEMTPVALDVLKVAKQAVLGDEPLSIEFIGPGDPVRRPVLALGSGPGDVNTLSVAQIQSKESALTDLSQALRLVLNLPEPAEFDYSVITTPEAALTLHYLGTEIDVDIEVSGDIKTDLPWEVDLLSVAFNDGKNIYVVSEEMCADSWVQSTMRSVMHERHVTMHNGKFDARFLNSALDVDWLYPDDDTMLMHFAMNHGAKRHGLKELAKAHFNAADWEKEIKQYTVGGAHYERIPRELLYRYNAGDVYWTRRLKDKFKAQLEADPPRRALYQRLMRISRMLQDVETPGLPVDVAFYKELSRVLGAESTEALSALRELVGNPKFNPGSWQQVKAWLSSAGIDVPSTKEDVLLTVLDQLPEEHPAAEFINALLEYRGIVKLKSTYADGVLRRSRDGVLFPQYLAHGTTTGRLSSKEPNIQNMPRPEDGDEHTVRKGLITEGPEFVNVQVDYSQAELRVLAEITGDPAMIAAFQPGAVDYFDAMMPNAYPEMFPDLDLFLEFKEDKEHKAEAKNLRAKLKGVQYGLNYGRMVAAIARALKMSRADAKKLVAGIFDTYPGLGVWQKQIRRAITDPSLSHMLVTPFNRRFQYEVVTSKNRNAVGNAALAFVPQSTANDITLNAALEVHERAGQYGFRITGLIHDAIVGHGPRENAEDYMNMVKTEMRGSAAAVFHRVPFEVDGSIGMNWAEL